MKFSGHMHPRHAIRLNTTTRRFPRSLADAFPDERAHCIDVPRRPLSRIGGVLVFVAILLALVALAYKLTGPV